MTKERYRLKKNEYQLLLDMIVQRGYTASPSVSKQRIDVLKKTSLVASFVWVPETGWQVHLITPPIRTHQDINLTFDEIDETAQANQRISEAWQKYSDQRTDESWGAYIGALASYHLRQFRA